MRFMLIRKADADTEAGVLPSPAFMAAMQHYNDELAQARRRFSRCRPTASSLRAPASSERRRADGDRRAVHREQGTDRWIHAD